MQFVEEKRMKETLKKHPPDKTEAKVPGNNDKRVVPCRTICPLADITNVTKNSICKTGVQNLNGRRPVGPGRYLIDKVSAKKNDLVSGRCSTTSPYEAQLKSLRLHTKVPEIHKACINGKTKLLSPGRYELRYSCLKRKRGLRHSQHDMPCVENTEDSYIPYNPDDSSERLKRARVEVNSSHLRDVSSAMPSKKIFSANHRNVGSDGNHTAFRSYVLNYRGMWKRNLHYTETTNLDCQDNGENSDIPSNSLFSIEGEENDHEVDSGDGSHQMEADYMEADVIDLQDEDDEYVHFGIPDCICVKSGAHMWYEERVRIDPVGDNTDKGKVSLASLDNEVTDSPAIEENKMNDILKGLLDCDFEELEGEGAMNLLQERLQVKSIAYQANSMDKRSRRSDGPEQCLQEKAVGSAAPVNGQKRVKSCMRKGSKGKRLLRNSLADAGTSWESGVRRSTRFRTKPLEYWKGERMVYGRVHESLSTVIGVKCMSPGSDGKPTMKAKSFVSDKYKVLFEIASEY